MAAVCDCFVLGFKVIAGASRLTWSKLDVRVSGTLDRVDKKMRFTHIAITAELTVPADQAARAPRILEKAEENCLVMNSLTCRRQSGEQDSRRLIFVVLFFLGGEHA